MRMATKAKSDLTTRRPTNVSLNAAAVLEAKALGINVSKACECGLLREVRRERDKRWQEENMPAIQAWNAWFVEHGLPIKPMF